MEEGAEAGSPGPAPCPAYHHPSRGRSPPRPAWWSLRAAEVRVLLAAGSRAPTRAGQLLGLRCVPHDGDEDPPHGATLSSPHGGARPRVRAADCPAPTPSPQPPQTQPRLPPAHTQAPFQPTPPRPSSSPHTRTPSPAPPCWTAPSARSEAHPQVLQGPSWCTVGSPRSEARVLGSTGETCPSERCQAGLGGQGDACPSRGHGYRCSPAPMPAPPASRWLAARPPGPTPGEGVRACDPGSRVVTTSSCVFLHIDPHTTRPARCRCPSLQCTSQGTRVRALVWEDHTCRRATGPVSHNY
ncbi:uncharacterized protein LOC132360025 [Balaenoptera ricei]|uniref:uncharacterized protein LOC132360025 n=1 Tax=Balaenoptera ricei TaxID=2746895 RepID=UPI0028BF4F59|nr:uncharacterized protein LOC132360025 [Balaenoptera ricei]